MKNIFATIIAIGAFLLSQHANAVLIDRGNGLIYDTVLNITWTQDANLCVALNNCVNPDSLGRMSWSNANTWAANLVYAGLSGWRLPRVSSGSASTTSGVCNTPSACVASSNELGYMFQFNLNSSGHPVDGVTLKNIPGSYWSGTAYNSTDSWEYLLILGLVRGITTFSNGAPDMAWAVHDGDVGAQVTLNGTPASLAPGNGVTASWAGLTDSSPTDWIGLYAPGAGDGSFQSWMYVSCSQTPIVGRASGSCVYGLPGVAGTYELRLFSNDGFTRLATSNPIILQSGLPVVTITVSDGTATEGNSSDTAMFTVSRTGGTSAPLAVNYTISGTATNGVDYQSLNVNNSSNGSVTIPAGASSAAITIIPLNDNVAEGNETVVLTLSPNAAYTVGAPASGTVTIVDDDVPAGTSLIANPAASTPGGVINASWSGVANPTARDWIGLYTPGAGNTSFQSWIYVSCLQTPGAGAAAGSCPYVLPNVAGIYELRLFSNDSYSVLASSNSITASASSLPVVSIAVADGIATEGTPSDTGIFTVSRTGSTAAPLTVNYTTGGTAINGTDYQTLSGTVTIPAGSSSAQITVTTIDDNVVEANESVVLTLNADSAYTVGLPSSGTVTIVDNETASGTILVATPSSVAPGSGVTVTWNGIAAPAAKDWIGLYTPGAGNTSFQSWMYVSCSQTPAAARPSGSCVYGLPGISGTYELRLLSNDGFSSIATSNPISIR